MIVQRSQFGAVAVQDLGTGAGLGKTLGSVLLRSVVIAPALYIAGSRDRRVIWQALLASVFVEGYNIGRQTRRAENTTPPTQPTTGAPAPVPNDVRYI